jgi:hypothetical protein
MDISGKVIQVLPKQTGNGKNGTWEKQDYVIEIQGTYPKKVCFNLWGAKISQFDIKEGEFINIGVDIESREYQGRWYTDVRAWKVERPGAGGAPMGQPMSSNAPVADPFGATEDVADPFAANSGEADDLPF